MFHDMLLRLRVLGNGASSPQAALPIPVRPSELQYCGNETVSQGRGCRGATSGTGMSFILDFAGRGMILSLFLRPHGFCGFTLYLFIPADRAGF
ncbi:hypothetical protein KKD52_11570, partial [Myxococcota bacterium]|nr:hypothetical protein [Myxococcota bacterium]